MQSTVAVVLKVHPLSFNKAAAKLCCVYRKTDEYGTNFISKISSSCLRLSWCRLLRCPSLSRRDCWVEDSRSFVASSSWRVFSKAPINSSNYLKGDMTNWLLTFIDRERWSETHSTLLLHAKQWDEMIWKSLAIWQLGKGEITAANGWVERYVHWPLRCKQGFLCFPTFHHLFYLTFKCGSTLEQVRIMFSLSTTSPPSAYTCPPATGACKSNLSYLIDRMWPQGIIILRQEVSNCLTSTSQ